MFASLNTHEDKDQSYRDDLWSILFSFVDILLGQLPWSEEGKKKEKLLVKELKREYTTNVQEEKFTKWIVGQILTTESEVSHSHPLPPVSALLSPQRVSSTQPIKVKEEDMSWNFLNEIFNHLNVCSFPFLSHIFSLLFSPSPIQTLQTMISFDPHSIIFFSHNSRSRQVYFPL
jgi:hypothetical protein